MAKKKNKKTSETIPYLFKASNGIKYALVAVHNKNPDCPKGEGDWYYDLKDTETGEYYYDISYNKIKDYL